MAAPALAPLPPGDVRLGEGSVFLRAQEEMLHLARAYPVDRLLAVFRRNAGLDTRGALPPGTWEDFGHPAEDAWGEHDYPGRENAQTANLLRGHYAGHFLSMLSWAYAGTGDVALREKAHALVAGLGEVQRTLAATGRYSHPGFLAAYGEWQFSRLEDFAPYGEIWAPYYTCHKILAGLLDAFELTGSTEALRIATAMGHWVHGRLAPLDPERVQRMWSLYIAGEYGGMNETLARLSVAADEPLFARTAGFFEQERLIRAGAAGEDVLTDMHANQHLPQLVGYVRQYELGGREDHLAAAAGLWEQIVPGRTYAHGGTGESELWGPPGTVAGDIGHRNAETCASYNMLKLSRLLFQHTLDPKYMDYSERTVLNHILGSRRAVRSDTSPEVTYMFPVHPGALREYDNVGTCCGGTGLENHVTLQGSVAFERADELWLCLPFPAELSWRSAGLELSVRTAYPLGEDVTVRVRGEGVARAHTLVLRIPGWLAAPVPVRVNGRTEAEGEPGSFVRITRDWRDGDEVDFTLPLSLRVEPTVDDPGLCSIRLGPGVLLARSEATTTLEVPLAGSRTLDGGLLVEGGALRVAEEIARTGAARIGDTVFEPCWSGADSRYHMYVRSRDPEVTFAGVGTGVPNRVRADGSTLLDAVWATGGFADREAFLDRVHEVCAQVRAEGLLGRDEWERVRLGAEAMPVPGGTGRPEASARPRVVPGADAEGAVPPAVTIEVSGEPAPSGWFTTAPTVSLRAFDVDGARARDAWALQWRLGEGEWRDYTGPFVVEDGAHVVSARVRDEAGLVGTSRRALSVDTAAPVSEATWKELGASVEITLHARDEVSGVERIRWQGPGTFFATFQEAFVRALGDEPQVIEFAATDRAGNEEALNRIVLPARGSGRPVTVSPAGADGD